MLLLMLLMLQVVISCNLLACTEGGLQPQHASSATVLPSLRTKH